MGLILKCNKSEISVVSASPMVGKASTALTTICERGSCEGDHSGTYIDALRAAGKCECNMRLVESVRRIDMLG